VIVNVLQIHELSQDTAVRTAVFIALPRLLIIGTIHITFQSAVILLTKSP